MSHIRDFSAISCFSLKPASSAGDSQFQHGRQMEKRPSKSMSPSVYWTLPGPAKARSAIIFAFIMCPACVKDHQLLSAASTRSLRAQRIKIVWLASMSIIFSSEEQLGLLNGFKGLTHHVNSSIYACNFPILIKLLVSDWLDFKCELDMAVLGQSWGYAWLK